MEKTITLISNRRHVEIDVDSIIYVRMNNRNIEVHLTGGRTYESRYPLEVLEEQLGDGFIRVYRSCIVSVLAIHEVGKTIELINGEHLYYPVRKKREVIEELWRKRLSISSSFKSVGTPQSTEEYQAYFRSFEHMPFAFTDIEIVFDGELRAVDWIFRYGNQALAKLEKLPLDKLIGKAFGDIFYNMDPKWISCYERAALYGERLELMDYSPEIDTYIKVICFPTFRGHCGCILMDLSELEFKRCSNATDTALEMYLGDQFTVKSKSSDEAADDPVK